ncbi:hypothetical protein CR513_23463, partial [Mucuna pruriens]
MKHPIEDHSLFGIDLIDELVEEHLQLDTNSDDISNFTGDTDIFGCLGSITDEADYDESGEVYNLSDSEDDIINLADLSPEVELLDLLDQVYKYEDPECSNNVDVQVAETKKQLLMQVGATFITEYESANIARRPKDGQSRLANDNSGSEDRKQSEAESVSNSKVQNLFPSGSDFNLIQNVESDLNLTRAGSNPTNMSRP